MIKSEKKFWSDREWEKRIMGSYWMDCLNVRDRLNSLDIDWGLEFKWITQRDIGINGLKMEATDLMFLNLL